MLMTPFTMLPYKPTVDSFLAGLNIEYKSEDVKGNLLRLSPNRKADRECMIKNYIIREQEYLPYRHKFLLVKELEKALLNQCYDFNIPFEYDYEANEPSASPWAASEIHNPRGFFEDIYRLASEEWKEDLQKAAQEDPSTW